VNIKANDVCKITELLYDEVFLGYQLGQMVEQ